MVRLLLPIGTHLAVELRGREPGATVLHLHGELDVATVHQVDAALRDLDARGDALTGLDLSRLTFIDCSGLGVLLEAQARARALGSPLEVVLGDRTRRLAELTGTIEQLTSRPPGSAGPERPYSAHSPACRPGPERIGRGRWPRRRAGSTT